MSTLAVFVLLAGGGAIAASKLKRNGVKSRHIAPDAVKGVDADEATFEKVPAAGSADTASSVAPGSIGPAGVQDPTRSVNLPLPSFIVVGEGEPDFAGAGDTDPDFAYAPTSGLSIEFDDDAGNEDSNAVESTFLIPPDYASGGHFAVRVDKATISGGAERIIGAVTINGGALSPSVFAAVTSTDSALVTLTPTPLELYAAGKAVDVNLFAQRTGGLPIDDDVWVHGVEFRYKAQQ